MRGESGAELGRKPGEYGGGYGGEYGVWEITAALYGSCETVWLIRGTANMAVRLGLKAWLCMTWGGFGTNMFAPLHAANTKH